MKTGETPGAWALVPLLALATGAYAVLPGAGYMILVLALLALLASTRWRLHPGDYLPAPMLFAVLLFNAVFLVFGLLSALPPRLYVLHLFSLLMFAVSYACTRLAYSAPGSATRRLPLLVGGAGLALLLLGQLLQAAGMLGFMPPPASNFLASLVFRPGGFLNTNLTAAIALVLLYQVVLHRRPSVTVAGWIVLALALVVIALTQSRSALLALFLYGAWLVRRHPWPLLLALVAVVVAAWASGVIESGALLLDLTSRLSSRFSGDDSSDERAWMLRNAFQAIQDAPWLGHGYQYLTERYGLGSHNTLIEMFVSFGAVGAVLLLASGLVMISPASGLFIAVCVLPSLLFSHNYFDSASLQVALGIALASERATRGVLVGKPIGATRPRVAG